MSPPPPIWANDPRIPFDPPALTLKHQAMIEKALFVRCRIPKHTLVYQILEDFGKECQHERLAWHGYPVGEYDQNTRAWDQLEAMNERCTNLLAALGVLMDTALALWKQLMVMPNSKCMQIETILLDQPAFWTCAQLLTLLERQSRN